MALPLYTADSAPNHTQAHTPTRPTFHVHDEAVGVVPVALLVRQCLNIRQRESEWQHLAPLDRCMCRRQESQNGKNRTQLVEGLRDRAERQCVLFGTPCRTASVRCSPPGIDCVSVCWSSVPGEFVSRLCSYRPRMWSP